MKKIFLTLFILMQTLAFAEEAKIAVVDLKRALQEVNSGKSAKEKLEKEFNAKKAALDKKQNEIQKLRQDFEKKASLLSQEKRAEEGQKIESQLNDYRELLGKSQSEMQKRESELTTPILDGLQDEIKKMASEKKVTLVLEKSQAAVLFNESNMDITDDLIKRFNNKK